MGLLLPDERHRDQDGETGLTPPEAGTAAFVVHGLPQLRVALAAARAAGCGVVALSGPGAAAYAGPGWFVELLAAGRAEYPDVPLTGFLDCADQAGDAIIALRRGVPGLVFAGPPEAAARLAEIAAAHGAALITTRPSALDLALEPRPDHAALAWCARLPKKGALVK